MRGETKTRAGRDDARPRRAKRILRGLGFVAVALLACGPVKPRPSRTTIRVTGTAGEADYASENCEGERFTESHTQKGGSVEVTHSTGAGGMFRLAGAFTRGSRERSRFEKGGQEDDDSEFVRETVSGPGYPLWNFTLGGGRDDDTFGWEAGLNFGYDGRSSTSTS